MAGRLSSVAVWAHHMYATGAVLLAFFSFTTFLIAIPTGIKFFNWIGTMWKGQLEFREVNRAPKQRKDPTHSATQPVPETPRKDQRELCDRPESGANRIHPPP